MIPLESHGPVEYNFMFWKKRRIKAKKVEDENFKLFM